MSVAVSSPITVPELEQARQALSLVAGGVSAVYIGDPRPIDWLLVALLAQGHALIEGVPGIAKTTLVRAFASALGCHVRRIQFTPDLLPSDITGTFVFSPRDATFNFRPGPIFGNIILADEINRAPAKTQAALLEAMAERQVTVEGERFALPEPFLVFATQNPLDLAGTYALPEAQLDRFLIHVRLGYPSHQDEVRMLRTHGSPPPEPRAVLTRESLAPLLALVSRVHVEDDLLEYVVALARFTRQRPRVSMGASPRASLGLLRASKAHALLHGRPFVTPDDVKAVAPCVLGHRLILDEDVDPQHREGVVVEALREVSYRRSVRAF
jgi:MoxR-like ATPase